MFDKILDEASAAFYTKLKKLSLIFIKFTQQII